MTPNATNARLAIITTRLEKEKAAASKARQKLLDSLEHKLAVTGKNHQARQKELKKAYIEYEGPAG